MTIEYRIAIPSFRRAATLRDKTLAYLGSCKVPARIVDVFVADDAERYEYEQTLIPGTYGRIINAVPGMGAVRRFIQAHYEEGAPVLNLDDDLKRLVRKVSDRVLEPVTDDFDEHVQDGFRIAAGLRARLWGIYPVANALFMRFDVTQALRYIVGCVWGVYNTRDAGLSVTLDDKEDFERTIKFFLRDGAVARLGYIAPVTNYYGEPGGMQIERTEQRVSWSARELVRRYPGVCSLNLSKKSGHAEVRLARIPH